MTASTDTTGKALTVIFQGSSCTVGSSKTFIIIVGSGLARLEMQVWCSSMSAPPQTHSG